MSQKLSQRRQQGMTLFEILLVLVVAAFIAVGVGSLYERVMISYRAGKMFEAVQDMESRVQGLYELSTASTTNLSTASVIAGGLAPKLLNQVGSNATHFWATTDGWTVIGNDGTGLGNRQIIIKFNDVPPAVCSALVEKSLKITGFVLGGEGGDSEISDPSAAIAACAGSDTGSTPGLVYQF